MSATVKLRKDRSTPGVYITEFPAFPPSIVGVATAVPIFVGYTETAVDPSSKKQMYLQPVAISSMSDFTNYFGGGFQAKGIVEPQPDTTPQTEYDFEAASANGSQSTSLTFTSTDLPFNVGTTNSADLTVMPSFNQRWPG